MIATGERLRAVAGGSRPGVRGLVVFFALAYAVSWSWVIPLAAAHQVVRRAEGWPIHYPALLGPAIAAVMVTAWTMGRPGVRDLLARMVRWRVAFRWWLWAVSPAAFLGLTLWPRPGGPCRPRRSSGSSAGPRRSAWWACCCSLLSAPWARRQAGGDMPCRSCSGGSAR